MWGCRSFFFWSFGHGGFGLGGVVLGLLVLAALLWILRTRSSRGSHHDSARADRDDALRLLDQRLADGGITPEEYERLRRAIDA